MDAVAIGFACYLTMILIIGFYTARITNNLKDFALGGQRSGPTGITFSERASGESACLAGIFISGAIAAMMSTADSQLLVSTTVLTEDITRKYFKQNTTESELLKIGRLLTIIIGVIAFYMAWQSKDLVFEMVSLCLGRIGLCIWTSTGT